MPHDAVLEQSIKIHAARGAALALSVSAAAVTLGPLDWAGVAAYCAAITTFAFAIAIPRGKREKQRVSEPVAPGSPLHRVLDGFKQKLGLKQDIGFFIKPGNEQSPSAAVLADTIFIDERLLRILPPQEIEAVLAHEVIHLKNKDDKIAVLGGVPELIALSSSVLTVFNFVAGTLASRPDAAESGMKAGLNLAVCFAASALAFRAQRSTEHRADLESVVMTGTPRHLSSALARMEYYQESGMSEVDIMIHAPKPEIRSGEHRRERFFSTHPSIPRRIDVIRRAFG